MGGDIIQLNIDPANRREQFRRTVIKGARIIFNDRQSTLSCRVRDMTAGGARLDLSTQQLLPHEFELHVSGSPAPQRCGLRWAQGTLVGVRFLPDAV
jgi:hypothetical protein